MIVPVQPKSVVPQGSPPISQSGRGHGSSVVQADIRPSVHIDRLVVESSAPISAASIRDGFREAWLHHDRPARRWTADAFRGDLTIDLPSGVTGRELGRRLAEAILQRAGSHG